ncbi:class I SAM-dependent methyltransferase [Amycolatopsis cihanbeyliensis]|uniref:Methyltransferase family protein n=1 Tax=Amycolatopsis cihanbeyliensis TaxID=1128664 RepID=A0A542DQL9_AMYCI|nr:class I SAM-dependent methyltransferase [Amycolatopsis cihanbeyliensis]TQJ05255.1 methyltransferase family protein [Amycolatopsis cihanbeyliensis]
MTVASNPNTISKLVDSFTTAPRGELEASYRQLVHAVWQGGDLTALAVPAVNELVPRMKQVDELRKAYLAELFGLLVQAEYPDVDGAVTAVVRTELDQYLGLWSSSTREQPLHWALLYLLSHFPKDRSRILEVAATVGLEEDDMSRLDRALDELDPDNPVIGRVFPYPSAYDNMFESEREVDRAWIRTLTPEQVRDQWYNDITAVRAHAGAKSFYAIRHGMPEPVFPDDTPIREAQPTDADDTAIYAPHQYALRCSRCEAKLTIRQGLAECAGCNAGFPIAKGMLNVLTSVYDGKDHGDDFLFQLSNIGTMAYFIDVYARPAFKRLCGMNWNNEVSPRWEGDYIREHLRPVDGTVLDLAAGGGLWTDTLADAVGAERVLALDILPASLATLRDRRPDVPAVVANARFLPFDDSSLGAVTCWDALQAFPDEASFAIAEVGRCLRPGGTFTLFTFVNSDDEIYHHFVRSHRFPKSHRDGLALFERDDLERWLAEAGLTVIDRSGPHLHYVITAQKQG